MDNQRQGVRVGGAMFRYPLEEIRGRIDIVELLSTYVNLRKSGKTLKALCPFHTEKTPSFIVNEELQKWHCYGCGEHGDVFGFLMKMENMTFSEAVRELAKRAGVTIQQSPAESKQESDREKLLRMNSVAASFFCQALRGSQQAMGYVQGRGISDEAIDKYGVGYAPGEWRALAGVLTAKGISLPDAEKAGLVIKSDRGTGYYDRFRDRIIFPIQDVNGRTVAFGGRSFGDEQPKYLNSPETAAFVKNRTLYGLNHARKNIAQEDRAIIVEGYLDAITAQCAGFGNAVATMGTALTPEHVNLLSRYTHNVVIAFDSDSAGMSATLRSAPMFEQAGFDVGIMSMPPGSDPDSLLREGDAAAFSRLVAEAAPLVEYRLELLKKSSDLTTDGGKAEMLKKAAPILAEVGSAVERDRYVRGLVQYHPNFGTGTARAEDSIRRDVESSLLRRGRGPAQTQRPAPPGPEIRKAVGSGLALAEKYLLRAMLWDSGYASRVFAELPPEQFASSGGKSLASAIAERVSGGQSLKCDVMSDELAGTEAGDLLSEIVVSTSGPEVSDQAVDDCLMKLTSNWKRQRMKELAPLVERGEISSTDMEFAEYWRLVQELHNTV